MGCIFLNLCEKSRCCNILNAVSDPVFLNFEFGFSNGESGFSRRRIRIFSSPSPGFLLVRVFFESESGPGFEVCRFHLGLNIAK